MTDEQIAEGERLAMHEAANWEPFGEGEYWESWISIHAPALFAHIREQDARIAGAYAAMRTEWRDLLTRAEAAEARLARAEQDAARYRAKRLMDVEWSLRTKPGELEEELVRYDAAIDAFLAEQKG